MLMLRVSSFDTSRRLGSVRSHEMEAMSARVVGGDLGCRSKG